MTKISIAKITPDMIASMLEMPLSEVWRYARTTERHYKPTEKRVVNGKEREFDVPKYYFKPFTKKLHTVLKRLDLFHASAHGGVKEHSSQTSAKRHCGKTSKFTRDIKNCFPSTTPDMIRNELCRAGFLSETARLLSLLLTVRGRVPQGASTSTDAINLLFLRMDRQISRLCKEAGFAYTRYVDDCVISGKDTALGKQLTKALENEIESIGLIVNQKKSKNMIVSEDKQYVHGLLVHRLGGTMIDSKKKRVALEVAKNYLDHCRKLTPASISETISLRKKLLGHCSYFKSATFSISKHLKKQLKDGDRVALRRMASCNIQCEDGKWWKSPVRAIHD